MLNTSSKIGFLAEESLDESLEDWCQDQGHGLGHREARQRVFFRYETGGREGEESWKTSGRCHVLGDGDEDAQRRTVGVREGHDMQDDPGWE